MCPTIRTAPCDGAARSRGLPVGRRRAPPQVRHPDRGITMRDYLKQVKTAYDRDPDREWARLVSGPQARLEFEVTSHALGSHLPAAPARILDAGGGPGRYTLALAARRYMMTPLDLSPALLDQARIRIAGADTRVQELIEGVVEGSITDLSVFPDGGFDAVICLGGPLSHVVESAGRRRALAELDRVARPGSPLLISVMNRFGVFRSGVQWLDYFDQLLAPFPETGLATIGPHRAPAFFFTPDGFVSELSAAGLTVERLYGCNGIGAHLQEENLLAVLDDEWRWPIWRKLLLETCDHPSIVGVSNHILAAGRSRGDRTTQER